MLFGREQKVLESGDTSRTRNRLYPCWMLAGCSCLPANHGREGGMRWDGNWEQRIPGMPRARGAPVLLSTELLTQLCHMVVDDELMS